jgi:hexosaminidase
MTLTFTDPHRREPDPLPDGLRPAPHGPGLCFSLMAAPKVISGGTMVRRVAGYAEVALPDLGAGARHEVVLEHAHKEFGPRNRAWLPLGAYLRVGKECLPCRRGMTGPAGGGGSARACACRRIACRLVPQPTEWRPSGGTLEFAALAPVPGLDGASDLAARLGLPAIVQAGGGAELAVTADAGVGAGGLSPDRCAHRAGGRCRGAAGLHYAAITLLTLRETCGGQLPCGVITDTPRFGYRGQHLDCARHFFGSDFILRLLDLMALLKLNRFHWHFADDEAFRLEVETQPLLWQRTAFRGEGELVPGVFGGGIRAGGSYSKADVARIVAHAKALQIEVLPEIEVPAHSHAMVKAVPGLRDPATMARRSRSRAISTTSSTRRSRRPGTCWCPWRRRWRGYFPLRILHLGADEAPHGAWGGSPAVVALKAREGLETLGRRAGLDAG